MNMEEDPIRKKERMRTIELFLDKDMEEINLCDTSSDEDETKDHLSEVTKSTVTTKEAPKIRNRLPGIIEKWNSDVSDEEENDNQNNDQDNDRDDEEESSEEDTDEDSHTSNNRRSGRSIPSEGMRRGSARAYADDSQLNVSTTSNSIQAKSTTSNSSQVGRRKQPQYENEKQANCSISSSSSQVLQSRPNTLPTTRKNPTIYDEDSQTSLRSNVSNEKEARRGRRIITDDSQLSDTQQSTSSTATKEISRNPRVDQRSNAAEPTLTGKTTQQLHIARPPISTEEENYYPTQESQTQHSLFTIEERLDETQSEAEDRILLETSMEIEALKKKRASLENNIDENVITEDSQLTSCDNEICSPILAKNNPPVSIPSYRTVTRSSATKKKRSELTEEEEDAVDVFGSYKKPKNKRK